MSLLLIFLSLGFGNPTPAMAQTLPPIVYSTTTAEDIVASYAIHYGIPLQPILTTLKCESGLSATAVGDYGTSFGVAQIHLSAHPDITKAQALDPLWAIDWTARQFASGHAQMWSCYKKFYA